MIFGAANSLLVIPTSRIRARKILFSDDGTAIENQDSDTPVKVDELGGPANSYEQITNYNNYYEFTTNKERVASLAEKFDSTGWQIEVSGLVHKPKIFGVDELLNSFTQEERIYRLRCVEAWSMVIPWMGFPLKSLLDQVEPMADAEYIRFESILDPEQMPGQKSRFYPWPYTEGLRMDEAMHDLTILATGLYGKPMPNQNGAPVRLVVPWKYGFKGGKSIVKIRFVEKMPLTTWVKAGPNEYGFYANVNPEVDHPRWSQSSEKPIGAGLFGGRIKTKMFNGYTEQVGQMYAGMDLFNNF
jgi:sulfoxide reductase catalytic subunit YedY